MRIFILLIVTLISACSSHQRPIHDYTKKESDPIREVLMKTIPNLRGCYEMEKKRKGKDFQTSIKIHFTIGSDGNVSASHVEELTKEKLSDQLHSCFNNVLSKMEFPRPLGGGVVDVKQPINFYPKEN